MSERLVLRSAQLPDSRIVDIEINGPLISQIAERINPGTDSHIIDLTGHVVSVGFAEPHAHLDKAFLADRVVNPEGDLMGAIVGLQNIRESLTHRDTVDRAVAAAHLLSKNGVTRVRTHADTTLAGGLTSVHALIEAKEHCAHFIDIQVAMLLEWPVTGVAGSEHRALARDAIAAGVDVIGGCPHLDPDPVGAVRYFFELSGETGLPLDLHADENLRTTSNDLETLADLALSNPAERQLTASHCVSLSAKADADIARIADKVARADISVVALPQTNLFLQGRGMIGSTPRAITPVNALLRAGAVVAAGADNLQDPFNPVGRGDPLETASLMVMASHVPVATAFDLVSVNSQRVLTRQIHDLQVGSQANLVAVRATNLRESIAMGPPDRVVVYGGVVLTNEIRNRK